MSRNSAASPEAGAPDPEIEVTPDMIEAGINAYYASPFYDGGLRLEELRALVRAVYVEMDRASPMYEITPEMIEEAVRVMYRFRLNEYEEDQLRECAKAILSLALPLALPVQS